MIGTIPNAWMETHNAYDRGFKEFSSAPGRRMPDSSGGIDPEDYNQTGCLWEALDRAHVTFANFGESVEFGGYREEWDATDTGYRMSVVFPMSKGVYDNTMWSYPQFNTNIPDQLRLNRFEAIFRKHWLKRKGLLPRLLAIQLPNDHLANPRREAGFPYMASYMADNDLGLGRMLQFLSHTPYWKEMLVVILEDDPQGGVDHVDAHRSILMMAGPYVKRGYVSHGRILTLPP
jgi:hypothetical protein